MHNMNIQRVFYIYIKLNEWLALVITATHPSSSNAVEQCQSLVVSYLLCYFILCWLLLSGVLGARPGESEDTLSVQRR